MLNQGLSKEFQFIEYPINQSLDDQSMKQVLDLFKSYYYSYHYLDKITMSDQYRILCLYEDMVVGYAAVGIKKNCGVLSNFLVHKSLQRRGIGTKIEEYSLNFCQNSNLCIYASTVITPPGSQFLKIKHGLVPINLKYGYRQGVYRENDLSSAVSFISGGYYRMGRRCDFEVNDKLKRIRIVSSQKDYVDKCLEKVTNKNEYYIDILVTKELASGMINNDNCVFWEPSVILMTVKSRAFISSFSLRTGSLKRVLKIIEMKCCHTRKLSILLTSRSLITGYRTVATTMRKNTMCFLF